MIPYFKPLQPQPHCLCTTPRHRWQFSFFWVVAVIVINVLTISLLKLVVEEQRRRAHVRSLTQILRSSHTSQVAQRICSLLMVKTSLTRLHTTGHMLGPSIFLSPSATKSTEEKGCANWATLNCPAGCHEIPGEGRENSNECILVRP